MPTQSEPKYSSILNEKIPPIYEEIALPESLDFNLIDPAMRPDREHPGRADRPPG